MENEAYAKNAINKLTLTQKIKAYRNSPMSLFLLVMVVLSAAITVFILFSIAAYILVKGLPHLTPEIFAWEYNSENVSMMPAIINTLTMTGLSLIFAVPIGVFSAIYLVEYAKRGNRLVGVVRITAETLSGIPSIVYGLFGYLLFVIACGFGYTIIGGALTLAIMILPLI
ncbi:MAG: phosphate ABC transporter, permease protein PstA, partial [Eubacteriales bacterium]|nr:phosphate ABC transporter, permease protein PstA [Eubacteriales bacterium]